MRIYKDSILTLASEGRCTLQVPDCIISFKGDEVCETEEVPDHWLHYLKDDVPCVGKETGFLYLTRDGYNANKAVLQAAFSSKRGRNWADFEAAAEAHFTKVEKASYRKKANLEKKLAELNRAIIKDICP